MLLPLLLPVLNALASAVEVKRPRGVSLTNHHFYEESKPFTCLDGSSTIAFEWVNDDYCDCQDGSDEPGTSACPNGRFHCTNAGYRPQYIPSSRVNDGVCDCCDATDEYNSGFVCENTCKEMGRKEREALAQMAEVAREGFQLKQVLIEEASKGREDKQRTLAELQEGKKSLEEQVETLRSVKEVAEKPEKEAKEIHQKKWEEQKAAEKAAREQARASDAFQELDDDGDGLVSVAELQTHVELDVDGDGTLSETEAQVRRGRRSQDGVASSPARCSGSPVGIRPRPRTPSSINWLGLAALVGQKNAGSLSRIPFPWGQPEFQQEPCPAGPTRPCPAPRAPGSASVPSILQAWHRIASTLV
uniref:PRKCSH beta subunit of glucosidase II n=1 Tax=Terrapene triunguis TaxID=2587831 RepID=A0A674JWS5_9SAUR